MRCPVCPDSTLVIADRQGIEIDYCPKCRGVWLDRGELDKIIERTAQSMVTPDSPMSQQRERGARERREYEYYDDDERYRYGRKRRGFLGELFDFD